MGGDGRCVVEHEGQRHYGDLSADGEERVLVMQSAHRCSVAHGGHHHHGELSEDGQSLTFGRTDGQSITWFRLHLNDTSACSEDLPGPYRILHAGVAVTEGFAMGSQDVAALGRGTVVDVLQVQAAPSEERIRGRIASPAGWISLLKT